MEPIFAEEEKSVQAGLELFLRRRDLVLLATGGLVCLRSIYQRAKAMGALARFRYAVLRSEAYVLGTAEDEIRRAVCAASALSGARVVVVYLSCLDILTRPDFTAIEAQFSETTGCVVRCFFRGPLAKADAMPHPSAAALLSSLPPEMGEVKAESALPPTMSDIAGISDLLRGASSANVLVTPSGCRRALSRLDMMQGQADVFAAIPRPEDYIFGMEDTLAAELEGLTRGGRYREVNLLTSPVPAFMALRGEEVLSAAADHLSCGRCFPADGFQDAVSGAASATLRIVREAAPAWREATATVLLIGYSELLVGDFAPFEEAAAYFASLGYQMRCVGRDALPERPALVWEVSAVGESAARWLHHTYGTPVVRSLPLGEAGRAAWKQAMRRAIAMGAAEETMEEGGTVTGRALRVLLIGDPVAMRAVGAVLCRHGLGQLSYAAYAWMEETARLYRQAAGEQELLCFRSKEELQAAWAAADVVVADPCLLSAMGKKALLPLPMGFLSGREGAGTGSGVLGKAFAMRLWEFLRTCTANT
ncbi:MAG: hypothetical protein ACTTJE_01115 [Schwartzia sp. (in: firmicutes)]